MDVMTLAERSPYVILVAVLIYGLRELWKALREEQTAHHETREKANAQLRANDDTLRSALEALREPRP